MSEYARDPKLPRHAKWRQAAAHPYHDEADRLIFVVRREVAQHPDGSPVRHEQTGKQLKRCVQFWSGCPPDGRKPPGARKLLYRLPQLHQAMVEGRTIYVAEGENKVDLLREWGLTATCAPEGAGKWHDEHAWLLRGAKRVVVLPDSDDRGRQHADKVGRSLLDVVGELRLLELPNLPASGDVVDWKRAGGTKEEFERLSEAAREWTAYGPEPESTRAEIEAIEIRPGSVDIYNVRVRGCGVVAVDAEQLNHFPWFNRACITHLQRAFDPPRSAKTWSRQVDAALRAAGVPEATSETPHRHGTETWTEQPIRWRVHERIPEQGVGLISAPFSMYKSFMLLDASACIMTGLRWLGARVVRRAGVLIFAAEGADDIPMRVAALIKHRLGRERIDGIDLFNLNGVELRRLPLIYISGCRPLLDTRTVEWMIKKAQAEQEYLRREFKLDLGLIGIDTISAAAGWDNENDAAQVQIVMNHLAEVSRSTGAFVMTVDHFGKDKTANSRGSSVKESSANTIMDLRGKQNDDGTVEDSRLVLRKQRSGPQGLVFPFAARVVSMGENKYGEPLTSRVVDWNVERPEQSKLKSKAQVMLEEVLTEALAEHGATISVNGGELKAVKKEQVRLAFKAAYQAEHTEASGKAANEAWRRALEQAVENKAVAGGTPGGVAYLWQLPTAF